MAKKMLSVARPDLALDWDSAKNCFVITEF